jgi:hypothetical protein
MVHLNDVLFDYVYMFRSLSGNRLQDAGAVALADALARNTGLRTFS